MSFSSHCSKSLKSGYLEATGLAEYLVGRGVAFRDAHSLVGRIVAQCEKQGIRLAELELDRLKQVCDKIQQDVYEYLAPEKLVKKYKSLGSAGTTGLKQQLAGWKRRLK